MNDYNAYNGMHRIILDPLDSFLCYSEQVSLKTLKESGKRTLIWFYPKAGSKITIWNRDVCLTSLEILPSICTLYTLKADTPG